MRPLNLTGTQFTLLRMLNELPSARVNDLAEALAMDQTTVSRTLALIKDAKLIERQAGEDRREARWGLTAAGRKKLREGSPLWESAQRRVESLIGADQAERLKDAAFRLTQKLAR